MVGRRDTAGFRGTRGVVARFSTTQEEFMRPATSIADVVRTMLLTACSAAVIMAVSA
jgi:hypothetical protein